MGQISSSLIQRALSQTDYYHGLLPREDIKEMLTQNGDWLLRMTEPSEPGKRQFVLSVCVNAEMHAIRHYVIVALGNKFRLVGDKEFNSIAELVEYYKTNGIVSEGVRLTRAIPLQPWELQHDTIQCTKKLGAGAFGEVSMGVLRKRNMLGIETKIDVAIKLAKLDNLTKDQIKEIMSEARFMRNFNHVNVVQLHGVAACQEPLMIVMELVSDGSLDSYLRKNTNLSEERRMVMTLQAARGIEYLHSVKCIHRDIAARNCLYGCGQVKISDFGLSKTGDSYQMDPKNKVPIKWLAPETLKTARYSQKTDVWSFGILAWEIFNNGLEPYPKMSGADVVRFVIGGKHLSIAATCKNARFVALIEKHCLDGNSETRWFMRPILTELESLTQGMEKAPETVGTAQSVQDMGVQTITTLYQAVTPFLTMMTQPRPQSAPNSAKSAPGTPSTK